MRWWGLTKKESNKSKTRSDYKYKSPERNSPFLISREDAWNFSHVFSVSQRDKSSAVVRWIHIIVKMCLILRQRMKNKQSLKYQGMWEKETCKSSFHFELLFLSALVQVYSRSCCMALILFTRRWDEMPRIILKCTYLVYNQFRLQSFTACAWKKKP